MNGKAEDFFVWKISHISFDFMDVLTSFASKFYLICIVCSLQWYRDKKPHRQLIQLRPFFLNSKPSLVIVA